MRKYVCDRCGKDVLSYRRTVLGVRIGRAKICKMTVTNDDEKCYDLCDACYKRLEMFLTGKDDAE